MIFNIIDRRVNKYRWKKITAIIEPVWHDNYQGSKTVGDMYSPTAKMAEAAGIGYHEIPTCSVAIAVDAANELEYPCTLFLYDHGEGINLTRSIQPRKAVEFEANQTI